MVASRGLIITGKGLKPLVRQGGVAIAALTGLILTAALSPAFFMGCGDSGSYVCSSCSDNPEADAADDGKPTGIYKGVVTGDGVAGSVRVEIKTDGSKASAKVAIQNKAYDLVGASTGSDEYSSNWSFTYDNFTLDLSLNASDGEVNSVSATYDGSSLSADVAKESSTELVQAFVGGWSGSAGGEAISGAWNFLLRKSELKGSYSGAGEGSLTGFLAGDKLTIESSEGTATGNLNGDTAGGAWEGDGAKGNWSGERRL